MATDLGSLFEVNPIQESRRIFDSKMPSRNQWWRLFIDRVNQNHNDPLIFDKDRPNVRGEPGYCQAMYFAFDYIRDTLGEPLNERAYDRLHDYCVHNVKKTKETIVDGSKLLTSNPFTSGFFSGCSYGFTMEKVTALARKEWKQKKLISDQPIEDKNKYLAEYVQERIYPTHLNSVDSIAKIEEMFSRYNSEILVAETVDAKLSAIVDLCRSLEIHHAFLDGNQRTIAFALLLKLLLENDLQPAILDEPYMFDGYYGTKEMVDLIKKGQENFRKLPHYHSRYIKMAWMAVIPLLLGLTLSLYLAIYKV